MTKTCIKCKQEFGTFKGLDVCPRCLINGFRQEECEHENSVDIGDEDYHKFVCPDCGAGQELIKTPEEPF